MTQDNKISPTLSRYLSRLFVFNLLGMGMVLLGVIWLFDVAELLRRAAKVDGVPLGIILQMGFLKLPDMAQTLFPFITLFAALFSFWQLSKRSELVVLRAAGISAWQFLRPFLWVGFMAGVFFMAALNPISTLFFQKYMQFENQYLEKNSINTAAIFEEGLWLRQPSDDGGYAILHANKVALPDWTLTDVFALFFDNKNNFSHRVDAASAQLKDTEWQFQNVIEHNNATFNQKRDSLTLPTNLSRKEIEDSFASPDTMGFWSMPAYIKTLERTGFDSTKLRIHFHVLLALPFLCCSMIILASVVALRPQRGGGTFLYIVGGVGIGFALFFISSFLQALGSAHQVPVFLAAWSPALLSILIGSTVLLTQEDG